MIERDKAALEAWNMQFSLGALDAGYENWTGIYVEEGYLTQEEYWYYDVFMRLAFDLR